MVELGTYRHFKGNRYEVIAIARHTETQEEMVVYRALYGERGIWVRPLAMWEEEVEFQGKTAKRFERILKELALKQKDIFAYFKGGTALYKALGSIRRFSEKYKLLDFSENPNQNKIQTYT